MFLFSLALTTFGSLGTDDSCLPKDFVPAVERGESLILHKAPFTVRRGPAGEYRKQGCVRVDFVIGKDGVARDMQIGHSSGSRVVDLSAIESISKSSFSAPEEEHAVSMVFVYSDEDNKRSE